jgi:hypothetical protein
MYPEDEIWRSIPMGKTPDEIYRMKDDETLDDLSASELAELLDQELEALIGY